MENNRKRARKTKLVPRTVADDDDECLPYYLPQKKMKTIKNQVVKKDNVKRGQISNVGNNALDEEISKYSQDLDFSLAQLAKLKKEISNDEVEDEGKMYDLFDVKFSVNIEVEEILDRDDEQVCLQEKTEEDRICETLAIDNQTSIQKINNNENIIDSHVISYVGDNQRDKCEIKTETKDQDTEEQIEPDTDELVNDLVEKNQYDKLEKNQINQIEKNQNYQLQKNQNDQLEDCQIQILENVEMHQEKEQELEKVFRGSNRVAHRGSDSLEREVQTKVKDKHVDNIKYRFEDHSNENVSEQNENHGTSHKDYITIEIGDDDDEQCNNVVKQIKNAENQFEFVDCLTESNNTKIDIQNMDNVIENVDNQEKNKNKKYGSLSKYVVRKSNPFSIFSTCKKKKFEMFESIKLSSSLILDTISKLTKSSTFPADKILGVHARNFWVSKPKVRHQRTPKEEMLQDALVRWRAAYWKKTHVPPIAYKCIICHLGWWHFSEFQNHFNDHDDPNIFIDLESYGSEIVLVASTHNLPNNKYANVKFDSVCYRCGSPFEDHKCAKKMSFYKCSLCKNSFEWCHEFKHHRQLCVNAGFNMVQCQLCKLLWTSDYYDKHMIDAHSVRSDLPTHFLIKYCSQCDEDYYPNGNHECEIIKRNLATCEHCYRTFKRSVLACHKIGFKSDVYCKACSEYLPKECMEVLHMVEETPNYMLAYKCLTCSKDDKVILINSTNHSYAHETNESTYVLVPKSLVPEYAAIIVVNMTSECASVTQEEQLDPSSDEIDELGGNITPGSPLKYFESDIREADEELEILQNEVHAALKSLADVKKTKTYEKADQKETENAGKLNQNLLDIECELADKECESAVSSILGCTPSHETYIQIPQQQNIQVNKEEGFILNHGVLDMECESAVSSILGDKSPNQPENFHSNVDRDLDIECALAVSSIIEPAESGNNISLQLEGPTSKVIGLKETSAESETFKSTNVNNPTPEVKELTDLLCESVVSSINDSSHLVNTENVKTKPSECDVAVSSILGLTSENNQFYVDYARRDNIKATIESDNQVQVEADDDDDSSIEEVTLVSSSNENEIIVLGDSDEETDSLVNEVNLVSEKEDINFDGRISGKISSCLDVKPDKETTRNLSEALLNHHDVVFLKDNANKDQISQYYVCDKALPVTDSRNEDFENLIQHVVLKKENNDAIMTPTKETNIIINNVFSLTESIIKTEVNELKEDSYEKCKKIGKRESSIQPNVKQYVNKRERLNISNNNMKTTNREDSLKISNSKMKEINIEDKLITSEQTQESTEDNLNIPKIGKRESSIPTDVKQYVNEMEILNISKSNMKTTNRENSLNISNSKMKEINIEENLITSEETQKSTDDNLNIPNRKIREDTTSDNKIVSSKKNELPSPSNEKREVFKDRFVYQENIEIKEEQSFDDEISSDTFNSTVPENESSSSSKLESLNANLEPEIKMVITEDDLKTGKFKNKLQKFLKQNKDGWNIDYESGKIKKVYKCHRCSYKGFHKEFKEHRKKHIRADLEGINKACALNIDKVTYEKEVDNHLKYENNSNNGSESENDELHIDEEINVIDIDSSEFKNLLEKANKGSRMCSKCGRDFQDLTEYLKHLTRHNLPEYTCPECRKFTKSWEELVLHTRTHVENMFTSAVFVINGKDERCRECKVAVNREQRFQHWERHLQLDGYAGAKLPEDILKAILDFIQKPEKRYRSMDRSCMVCEHESSRNPDYKRHLIEHLLDDAAFKSCRDNDYMKQCQVCGERMGQVAAFRSHMRDHAGMRKYWCEECNKGFSDSSNFAKHKKIHSDSTVMSCDICNKRYRCKQQLAKHLKNHEKVGLINCEYCSAVFPVESHYTKHLRNVHQFKEKQLPCTVCLMKFDSSKEKLEHEWQVHQKRAHRFDCILCGFQHRNLRGLKNHMALNHAITNPSIHIPKKRDKTIIKKHEGESSTRVKKRGPRKVKKNISEEAKNFTIEIQLKGSSWLQNSSETAAGSEEARRVHPLQICTVVKEEPMEQEISTEEVISVKEEPVDSDFAIKREDEHIYLYDDEEDMVLMYESD